MAPAKRLAAFRIDVELLDGLQTVWKRDGVQPAEQVRRAIRAWLESHGVVVGIRTSHRPDLRKRKRFGAPK